MIRCHCHAPAIYQGHCLFHQTPDGVRPNIDTYTGKVRRTKAEQAAIELAERRAMAKEKKAPKVIRPPKQRPPRRLPDSDAIVAAYGKGMTILEIGRAHNHCQRTISKVLKAAGVIPQHSGNRAGNHDTEAILADFLAGTSRRNLMAKYGITEHRLADICQGVKRDCAPGGGPLPTPLDEELVSSLYASGLTARQVARKTGVSETRILRFLRSTGASRPRFGQAS